MPRRKKQNPVVHQTVDPSLQAKTIVPGYEGPYVGDPLTQENKSLGDNVVALEPHPSDAEQTRIAQTSIPQSKLPRRQRTPLGTRRPRLEAKIRPGMVGRWVNDNGTRLQDAQDAGYEFVHMEPTEQETGLGARISRRVGVQEGGGALNGYLMVIPEVWYKEDQTEKQKQIDEVDQTIQRGNITKADPEDKAGDFYDAGIHISRG